MTSLSPLRYFFAMGLHPPYAVAILFAVLMAGVSGVVLNPATGLDDGVGMLLFVQMFLASSGFVERARRGHFDPLLTLASSRTTALVAHWTISALPGVLGWLALCVTAFIVRSPDALSMLCGTRAAALVIVSVLAWVGGFALARGTAGFLWTATLFVLLLRRTNMSASSPLAVMFCPFILMKPGPVDRAAVTAALLMTVVLLLGVWRYARRLDIFLLERG